MPCAFTRRTVLRLMGAAGLIVKSRPAGVQAQSQAPGFSYPMGLPGRPLGDGLVIRHGYATENSWYNPGWWHTGEDWYLTEGDTGGVGVYAAAAGDVMFAGSEYPGRVVILQHEAGLYSMYGHLDYALSVAVGESVERGQLLGTILARTDGRAPSHLHFEMRAFFTTPEVNGSAPRYGVTCGIECPPGPGYWPIDAPEHPSVIGWRNPTHLINRRAWGEALPEGAEVIVTASSPASVSVWETPGESVWETPGENEGAEPIGDLALPPGARFPLLDVDVGAADATGTSAEAYSLWYCLALPNREPAWVQAAVPSTVETGTDGRPSSLSFPLVPASFALA